MSVVVRSLLPPVKKTNPYIPYYIGCSAAIVVIATCVALYYASKKKAKYGYVLYPDQSKSYVTLTDLHCTADCLFLIHRDQ